MNAYAQVQLRDADQFAAAGAARPMAGVPASAVLAERIARARAAFAARAHDKVLRLAQIATGLGSERSGVSGPEINEIRELAHSLAGSAGSFGFGQLSEIAGALEDAILSGQPSRHQVRGLVAEIADEFLARVTGSQPALAR